MPSLAAVLPLVLVSSSILVVPSAGGSVIRREVKSHSSVSELQAALAPVWEHGGVTAGRMLEIEASVRPTYEAFPKNSMGQLPPQKIFPAIVRNYFAKEHGWLIHGLEPPLLQPLAPEVYNASVLQLDAHGLAEALEATVRAERGLSLSEVVGTVAALEALLLKQSGDLLKDAYRFNEHSPTDQVDEETLHGILQTYYLLFRHGGSVNISQDVHERMKNRAKQSKDWDDIVKFEHDAVTTHGRVELYDFAAAAQIARAMDLKFGKWQNAECLAMKDTLMQMDKDGSGRILFDDFHAEPKHALYQFTETQEYLRRIGALDESEDGKLQVIIPNYLLGPSNCIAPSKYYSVCCLRECESVLSDLESTIRAPQWPARELLDLVAETQSSTVEASGLHPRQLPPVMADDLAEIAARHDGMVPVHSADFMRWLHRAYPNECPLLTPSETVAEEAELNGARDWLEAQDKVCTRLPEWQEEVVSMDL